MGVLFGILAGLFYALSSLCARIAMQRRAATPEQTTWVTLVVTLLFFSVAVFVPGVQRPDPATVPPVVIAFFALAGILGSVVGRLANFHGLVHLGPARINQLIATDVLFALGLGALILSELPSARALAGMALVTGGVVFLSAERQEGVLTGRRRLLGVAFGLGAGLAYASRNVVLRLALAVAPAPVWGAAISAVASFAVYAGWRLLRRTTGDLWPRTRRALLFSVLAGLATCMAWLTYYAALQLVQVSVGATLKNTTILFTIILSWLFLRAEERLNVRVAISAVAITAGVALLV